jgi:hypothetical protein
VYIRIKIDIPLFDCLFFHPYFPRNETISFRSLYFIIRCSSPPSSPVDAGISSDLPQGHESDYTVWTFLEKYPSEKLVLETLGLPDSVWIDEKMEFKCCIISCRNYRTTILLKLFKDRKNCRFEWD